MRFNLMKAKNFCRCNEGCRQGLTLVEVLVVIAILAILGSLLMVALNNSRASSHETVCRNNLRQFAIAALGYEGAKRHLPPGTLGFGRMVPYEPFFSDETSEFYRKKAPHTSFQGILLSYMEHDSLSQALPADFFRTTATSNTPLWYPDSPGFTQVSSNGPAYTRCPADSLLQEFNESIVFGSHPVWYESSDRFAGETSNLLPDGIRPVSGHHGTNYAGCSGIYAGPSATIGSGLRGAMSAGEPRRLSEIRDGASNTYLIGEALGFRWEEKRVRLSWLIGGLARARGEVPVNESPAAFAGISNLYLGDRIYSPLSSFGSMHTGSVNFALVDGSTVAVSRNVNWFVHFRSAAIGDADGEVWDAQ